MGVFLEEAKLVIGVGYDAGLVSCTELAMIFLIEDFNKVAAANQNHRFAGNQTRMIKQGLGNGKLALLVDMGLSAALKDDAYNASLLRRRTLALIDLALHLLKFRLGQNAQGGEPLVGGNHETQHTVCYLRTPITGNGNATFRVHLVGEVAPHAVIRLAH